MTPSRSKVHIPLPSGGGVSGILSVPDDFTFASTPGVLLAHGAGGDLSDPLLTHLQAYLRGRGYLSLRIAFPYREAGRAVPDRESVLEMTVRSAFHFLREHPSLRPGAIFAGGRSMGGRVASQVVAGGLPAAGLILLAYPLHAPGRPERVRDSHLPEIQVPTLLVSGTRDALGPPEGLLRAAGLLQQGSLEWVAGADHSFHTLKSAQRSVEDVWLEVSETIARWLDLTTRGQACSRIAPRPAETRTLPPRATAPKTAVRGSKEPAESRPAHASSPAPRGSRRRPPRPASP